MKAIQILILVTLLFGFFNNANAQFYGNIGTGYSAPWFYGKNGEIKDTIYKGIQTSITVNDTQKVENSIKFNVGNGLYYSGELGYTFANNLSVGLNFYYLNNHKNKILDELPTKSSSMQRIIATEQFLENENWNYSINYSGRKIIASPYISYKYKLNRFSPELKLGVSMGHYRTFREYTAKIDYQYSHTLYNEYYYKYDSTQTTHFDKFHISPYASLALNFAINERLNIFVNATIRPFIDFEPSKGVQSFVKVNTSGNIFDPGAYENDDKKSTEIIKNERYNFRSYDFGLGITYSFGNNSEKSVISAIADSSFYVSLESGYALGIAKSQGSSFFEYYSSNEINNNETVKQESLSLGEGMHNQFQLGYFFGKNIGFELALHYNISKNFSAEQSEDGLIYRAMIYSAKTQAINPQITLKTAINSRFQLFSKMGLLIARPTINLEIKFEENQNHVYEEEFQLKLNGGNALGFNASTGIMLNIGSHFIAKASFVVTSMSYAPEKGEIIKYLDNGNDVTNQLDINDKVVEFVDEYTEMNTNANTPTKTLKEFYSFGSLGLHLGICYNF